MAPTPADEDAAHSRSPARAAPSRGLARTERRELVAILLGTGGRGRNAVALAQDVLARCGGWLGWHAGACLNSPAWTPWARQRRPGWWPRWRWPDASERPRSTHT